MANNEQVEKLDFNALITRYAGSGDRKVQERYLVWAVMQLMIKYFGRDTRLPDANVLKVLIAKGIIDKLCEKDVISAMKVLDMFYDKIACAFLDYPDFDPVGLRSEVMDFMRKEICRRGAV